jgi:hypothetical protein
MIIKKNHVYGLLIAVGITLGSVAAVNAQPDAAPIELIDAAPTDAATAEPATDTTPETEVSVADELREAIDAFNALRDRNDGVKLRVLIAGLASPLLTLLLTLGRRHLPRLEKKSRWIPLVLVAVGAAIGLTDHLALGATWMEAMVSGVWPAVSALIYDLMKPKKKD